MLFRRYLSVVPPTASNVAFIGLGNMGFPMVENLINKSGHAVSVFDTNTDVLKKAESLGAKPCSTPVEAASGSKYVVTMLPGNNQVFDTFTDISKSGVSSQIWIDCSTVSPLVSKKVSEISQTVSSAFIDAPVSGGVGGAQNASLTFMVGGDKTVFEDAKNQVLSYMGANIIHCGDKPGSGEVAKLCNNLVLAISMNAVSEAINLGKRLGVDANTLTNIINTSSGRCWSSDTYNPYPGILDKVPSSNNYDGGFATSLMLKDLRLALEAAESVDAVLNLGNKVESIYSDLESNGYGSKDFSVIYKKLSES